MKIFNHKLLTPAERKHLKKLDDLVLSASSDELKKIQEIDHQTQMEGLSFYDVYVDSSSLINQSIKNHFKES
jgi:hypothetical protein